MRVVYTVGPRPFQTPEAMVRVFVTSFRVVEAMVRVFATSFRMMEKAAFGYSVLSSLWSWKVSSILRSNEGTHVQDLEDLVKI